MLEGDILFLTLPCITVARTAVTPEIMATMLAADNGVSTSSFQLYDAGEGKVTVTLNNFCKLQDMGPEDEDDILSCVHFLLVDVMTARRVLSGLSAWLKGRKRRDDYGIPFRHFRTHGPGCPRTGKRRCGRDGRRDV